MLKEIVVSAVSTDKYIDDTIYIIVDHVVGIFPFSVKCNVTDMLLTHRAAEVSFQSAQPTKKNTRTCKLL